MLLALIFSGLSLVCLSSLPFILLRLGLHTLVIVCLLSHSVSPDTLLAYFLPSVIGSLLWFMGSLVGFFGLQLLVTGLLLKLRMFPFHYWGLKVVRNINSISLFILIVPAKVPILTLFLSSGPSLLLLSFIILFCGCLNFVLRSFLSHILVWSSHLTLGFLLLMGSPIFFFYLFLYSFSLLLLLFSSFFSVSREFACLSLSGLPPLYMFWVKLYFLSSLPHLLCLLVLLAFAWSALGWLSIACSFSFYSNSPTTSFGTHFLLLMFVSSTFCSLLSV